MAKKIQRIIISSILALALISPNFVGARQMPSKFQTGLLRWRDLISIRIDKFIEELRNRIYG